MSFNFDSNLRLQFGRERQAELLHQAQQAQLEHGLLAESALNAGLQPHPSRSIRLRRSRQPLPREAR